MVTKTEMFDSINDNIELSDIQNELDTLQWTLKLEDSITKIPYESGWAIVFDYEKQWQKWEIVTRKEWNTYKVRIKKWTRLPNWRDWWQTQKNWNSETFNFEAKDNKEFNKQLWIVLNRVIGSDRDKLPKTGWKVYEMLNKIHQDKEQIEQLNDMPKWLELDHWTYIYTVQSGDSESVIKQKLSTYAPLNYLRWVPSGISGFNFASIPDKQLKIWLKIPVPKPDSERIKKISDFKKDQKLALNEIKNNTSYWDYIKKLIDELGEDHIANVMTAYAKSETCPENYNDNVWEYALFRYESNAKYLCPSYWYHHVLYKGAWLIAFRKLWMTIWQSCNPKESWELFLAFCIEKINWAQKKENRGYENFKKFFDMDNTDRCTTWYNWWQPGYSNKLKRNFDIVEIK